MHGIRNHMRLLVIHRWLAGSPIASSLLSVRTASRQSLFVLRLVSPTVDAGSAIPYGVNEPTSIERPHRFRPPPASTGIFRSPELLTKDRRRHASTCCVVTFESYTDTRTLDRPGFGEVFFDANGIDAIHIIPRNNDGYQYPEIDKACRRIRELSACYPHVVAYGQKMGGYGAIRLSGRVGAQVALAISPQSSSDPAVAPLRAAGPATRAA